jgi:hypothetical protein
MAAGRRPRANSSAGRTSRTVTIPSRARDQLAAGDRLQAVALGEVAAQDAVDLGGFALGNPAQRRHEPDDALIRQPVVDELAVTAVRDQPGSSELLEVLRGIADAEAGALGERLDAALALSEMLEQPEPVRALEASRHQCQLLEKRVLRTRR